MANYFAAVSGNFNDANTWASTPGGAGGAGVPTTGDYAYANGKTVTITANATCTQIANNTDNGATSGGSFTLNSGITLTANVVTGAAVCVNVTYSSPNTSTITGNVTGGTSTGAQGISITGTGSLTINGALLGGSGTSAYCVNHASTGTLTIVGNVTGGTGATGLMISGAANVNITGNVTGGTFYALVTSTSATGVISITGNVNGGAGASNAYGVLGQTAFTLNITGNVGNSATSIATAIYMAAAATGTISVVGNIYGSNVTVNVHGINTVAPGSTINVTGNVNGSTGNSSKGIYLGAINITVNVTGSVYGNAGDGIIAGYTGDSVNVTGSAFAGTNGHGVNLNASGSSATILRAVGNGYGTGSAGITGTVYGINSVQGANALVQQLQYGSLGNSPTGGAIRLNDTADNWVSLYRYGSTPKVLYSSFTVADIWNAQTSTLTTSGSIGERLKNASTVASTGQQLANAL